MQNVQEQQVHRIIMLWVKFHPLSGAKFIVCRSNIDARVYDATQGFVYMYILCM